MRCPKCNSRLFKDNEIDACRSCCWSTDPKFDFSSDPKAMFDGKGGLTDQWGHYYAPETSMARSYRIFFGSAS